MQFIQTKEDLIKNILTLESYLHSKNPPEREFAENLIRRGKTILVYKVKGGEPLCSKPISRLS